MLSPSLLPRSPPTSFFLVFLFPSLPSLSFFTATLGEPLAGCHGRTEGRRERERNAFRNWDRGERRAGHHRPDTLEGSEGFTDVLKVIVIIRKNCLDYQEIADRKVT